MFSLLGKIVLQKRNLLSSIESLSLIRFISTDSITSHQNSFTISYLINSCGLSQQKALSASKYIHFESPTNPDSVLTLLRNNGFSDYHISKIIAQRPTILVASVDKTLKPKFDFFNSKGLSGDDFAKSLCCQPSVLGASLEKTIIPCFDFLKSILRTDEIVIVSLKRSIHLISSIKTVETNIAILRSHCVPISNIQKLLVSQPRVFITNPSRFSENVDEVKKMKFDPSQYMFLVAVHVLCGMSRSSLEAKFDAYRSWGWSEDEVQCVFRKHPISMALSEKNIMSTMDFIVTKMGYNASSIAKQPVILHYSLGRRIIPRCSVIQFLVRNGLVEKLPDLRTLLNMLNKTEDVFLKNFVIKFEKTVPELLNVYEPKSY